MHASDNVDVIAVAMDAQGADRARPYVERAGATFTTLVDEENLLGEMFDFKLIPNGILIDEDGIVRYMKVGGFDVRKLETAAVVEKWATGADLGDADLVPEVPEATASARVMDLFREGQRLYSEGDIDGAVAKWREGLSLDPKNYIIRKQIWAVENPDRFYDGAVDYDWQREQTAKGL